MDKAYILKLNITSAVEINHPLLSVVAYFVIGNTTFHQTFNNISFDVNGSELYAEVVTASFSSELAPGTYSLSAYDVNYQCGLVDHVTSSVSGSVYVKEIPDLDSIIDLIH